MANTTFLSNVRSGGGDSTKTTYAGSVSLQAQFYFVPTAAQGTDVQVSATDTRKVVLPKNAIVTGITFNGAATGGTNPTVDMGYTDLDGGTDFVDVDGLLNEADADGGIATVWGGDSTSGASLGNLALPATEIIKIVGGQGASAATGGTVTGIIYYYVKDDGKIG
jgi:hypothetical protein|tara:strand:+ start:335 stop:829 length:495 start_codon:yes stop_codon:yes gene_type:complete